ncbi:MAG: RNA polymerase sigma factor [Candidatus Sumerlaeota bacterium]|nr:RNA polymerase sigma factor [Candidatus Sumerlaeota bacterium]
MQAVSYSFILATSSWELASSASEAEDEFAKAADGFAKADDQENELARRVYRDPEAFVELYRRYYDRIRGFLYRRTMDVEVADDLTARAFLAALEFLQRQERALAFRPWLYRIAVNVHLSHQRNLWRRLKHLAQWARQPRRVAAPPDRSMRRREDRAQLRRELDALPDAYRLALMLRYDEELPYDEIARALKIKEGAVRSRVSRGLAMLRKQMRG